MRAEGGRVVVGVKDADICALGREAEPLECAELLESDPRRGSDPNSPMAEVRG